MNKKFSIKSTTTQLEKWLNKQGKSYESIHADYGSRYVIVKFDYLFNCKIRISDHNARYEHDYSISPLEWTLSLVKKELKKLFKEESKLKLLEERV